MIFIRKSTMLIKKKIFINKDTTFNCYIFIFFIRKYSKNDFHKKIFKNPTMWRKLNTFKRIRSNYFYLFNTRNRNESRKKI